MSKDKKKSILFIQEENSDFDYNSPKFDELFESVDMVLGEQKALKLIHKNSYDVVINDMSVAPEDGITFMKQLKEFKVDQEIVTLMLEQDEDKLGDLMENGIHTFILTPEQLDAALEAIAEMATPTKS